MKYYIDPATGQDYAYDDNCPAELIKAGLVPAPKRPSPLSVWQDGQWQTPTAPAPSIVTPRQARLALHQADLLDSVKAAIAAADEATRIEWEYATTFERASPVVAAMSATLGLTESQLDELFTLAATL